MLTGFENETSPLTDAEKEFLPALISVLEKAKGRKNALTNGRISQAVGGEQVLTGARIRKLINYLRQNDLVLCLVASSHGYYIAENEEEILRYEESLMGRELAIRNVRDSLTRQRNIRYNGGAQGKLFL